MLECSIDDFLGGRIKIKQPIEGYRAAMDPVLLAAALPAITKGRVLDLGGGVGTAGLCYLSRVDGPDLVSLEMDPELAQLARENAAANDLAARVQVVTGDLMKVRDDLLTPNGFEAVLTNPPYLKAGHADRSPNAIKDRANMESSADLKEWLAYSLRMLKQKGRLAVIHRADRLDEILSLLQGKVGELTIIPLWPRQGREAKRVIVTGRKSVKGPTRLTAGLILHPDDGERYTPEATAILRDGGALTV